MSAVIWCVYVDKVTRLFSRSQVGRILTECLFSGRGSCSQIISRGLSVWGLNVSFLAPTYTHSLLGALSGPDPVFLVGSDFIIQELLSSVLTLALCTYIVRFTF